jgi:hypothetical protein
MARRQKKFRPTKTNGTGFGVELVIMANSWVALILLIVSAVPVFAEKADFFLAKVFTGMFLLGAGQKCLLTAQSG